jgi:shikimate kinase / 3-dehydroquinate synthase
MALVLIGFMGAGKSSVAGQLAEALGVRALDSDDLLEQRLGHPPAREFELHGERGFRAKEQELVCELLAGAGPRDVVALGGGSVTSEAVRAALQAHRTVLLDVGPELAWQRIQAEGNGAERPLARDRDSFTALYAERRPLYEGLADAIVTGVRCGAEPALLRSLESLGGAPDGAVMLWASSASGDYPVFVSRGLLEREMMMRVWPLERSRSRPFLVSDETVAELYAERLGAMQLSVTIPAGERSKTLASAERIWRALAAAGMTRADHLVALGGGVVGDLAGFCAASYQRGVPFVQVPTTLVAQVDSAYGGKTGVDLPEAKNYVGAYHQPAAVLVDPDALSTLPAAELAAGWVEVLKTALIAGGELWDAVASSREVDERMIVACARVKLAVVAADERDAGRRQVLNLGHTVGHAIEAATGYARYRHGEAVGLGLLAALRLSGQGALREQVRELLASRALPTNLAGAGAGVDAVVEALHRDKKRVQEGVPFVLVHEPGDVRIGEQVEPAELTAAVAELAG